MVRNRLRHALSPSGATVPDAAFINTFSYPAYPDISTDATSEYSIIQVHVFTHLLQQPRWWAHLSALILQRLIHMDQNHHCTKWRCATSICIIEAK